MHERRTHALAIAMLFFLPLPVHAAMLTHIRDTLSTSEPSVAASHVVEFTTNTAVPASGRIRVMPQAGTFSIPATMSYVDADVAVATSSGYVERTLAASATADLDGVAVTPGVSGVFDVTLNSTTGIPAGARVRIVLGLAANVGDVSSTSARNPSGVGSYRIDVATSDQSGTQIDAANTMVAIVRPVTVSMSPEAVAPIRSNGLPSGTVEGNSSTVEISLQTQDPSSCRYSTVASTTYASMPYNFTGWNQNRTFSANISTQNSTAYTFYVRCKGIVSHIENTDDYVITFSVGATPESNTSIPGSGAAGRGGSGDFPNGSSVLYRANVSLSGWAPPNSTVTVLQDGSKGASAQARSDGSFFAQISGLERGVYTFVASAKDGAGRTTGNVSSTLTLEQGTNNSITELVLPPTVAALPAAPSLGDSVQLVGSAVPNGTVELSVVLKSKDPVAPTKYSATTTPTGGWSVDIPASSLVKGTYIVKARVVISDARKSDWGTTFLLGVGEAANDQWSRSDLNRDGKVNLVDFSILLTTWGEDGIGDINKDGTTNLADFSIMLFDWTG
jgi:hypothetical protein